jgi:hypothetical protein
MRTSVHDPRLPTALPPARGPLSDQLVGALRRPPGGASVLAASLPERTWDDEDAQLALYLAFEVSYHGLAGVDPGWDADHGLLALRDRLGAALLAEVDAVAAGGPGGWRPGGSPAATAVACLHELASAPGASLSGWVAEHGDAEHLRELAVHRSAYQLKEADQHSNLIARMPRGRAKAALVEIQSDEYGNGVPGASHQELFARTMTGLGLDPRPGRYLDHIPAATLATCNLLSVLASSRRWLAAGLGHLALFEMTSVGPMGRYARATEAAAGPDAARFYEVHVEADAHHEVLAVEGMVRPFVEQHPELGQEVVRGARWLTAVEAAFTESLLSAWVDGRTSLREPLLGSSRRRGGLWEGAAA